MNIESEKNSVIRKLIEDGRSDRIVDFLDELENIDVPWQRTTDQQWLEDAQAEIIKFWNGSKRRPSFGDDRWSNH